MIEQRTEEWKQARLGYVTASRFKDVVATKSGMGATATSYLLELIGETLTGEPEQDLTGIRAIEHGNNYESEALVHYEFERQCTVEQVGFVKHPMEELIGCSPDGVVDQGMIEIKCPYTRKEHVRTILEGRLPAMYKPQVYGSLWVTKRKWCDFVSYHPDFPKHAKICVVRVERDEAYIEQLAKRILEFRNLLRQALKEVNARYDQPF